MLGRPPGRTTRDDRLYVITYKRMVTTIEHPGPIGPRIRALRDAIALSLRDLAQRSGVSAPMLSQVERGETSPTLAVAERIAAGWTCACRSCCASTRAARSRSCAPASAAPARASPPPATAPRSSPRRCPASAPSCRATCWRPARAPAAPATRRCTSPAAARPRSCRPGRVVLRIDGERHELAAGDCVTFDADLPHHFENPGADDGGPARRRLRRPTQELNA